MYLVNRVMTWDLTWQQDRNLRACEPVLVVVTSWDTYMIVRVTFLMKKPSAGFLKAHQCSQDSCKGFRLSHTSAQYQLRAPQDLLVKLVPCCYRRRLTLGWSGQVAPSYWHLRPTSTLYCFMLPTSGRLSLVRDLQWPRAVRLVGRLRGAWPVFPSRPSWTLGSGGQRAGVWYWRRLGIGGNLA